MRLTSIQPSSFISMGSSLALEPFTAIRLLGGAKSSAVLMGRFLSSILCSVDGRGEAGRFFARGSIRGRVAGSAKQDAGQEQSGGLEQRALSSQVPCREWLRDNS